MKNYVCLNGTKIAFTPEQMAEIEKIMKTRTRLGDATVGGTVKIGGYECTLAFAESYGCRCND